MSESITCKICGKEDRNSFCEPYKTQMLERHLCFRCNFWTNMPKEDSARKDRVVIVAGNHYVIEPDESGNRRWSGFGGARFIIEFHDGRRVETHNLWHQGSIPECFKADFPDNAEFMREPVLASGYLE